MDSFRFRVMTVGSNSDLRIYDVRPEDHGVYRCTVTGKGVDHKTVTLYQVIEFN